MGMRVQEGDTSGEQDEKISRLREAVSDILKADAALAEWCTDSALRRYLVARQWVLSNAAKMLQHTLEWRRTYRPHEITWDSIAAEATGKQFLMPAEDKEGRQIVIMRPREERSSNTEGQIRFLVYTLEIASHRADTLGQGKLTWLVDFCGYSMRNAPSLRVSMQTLNILQSHYPERLGRAICYHAPRLFNFSWRALQPFLDPATAKKVLFITKENEAMQMPALFPMDKMEPCLGGSGTFTYDRDAYGRFCRDVESCMRGGLPPQLPLLENGANGLESQQGRVEQLQLQQ